MARFATERAPPFAESEKTRAMPEKTSAKTHGIRAVLLLRPESRYPASPSTSSAMTKARSGVGIAVGPGMLAIDSEVKHPHRVRQRPIQYPQSIRFEGCFVRLGLVLRALGVGTWLLDSFSTGLADRRALRRGALGELAFFSGGIARGELAF